jgi:hypothetical protein
VVPAIGGRVGEDTRNSLLLGVAAEAGSGSKLEGAAAFRDTFDVCPVAADQGPDGSLDAMPVAGARLAGALVPRTSRLTAELDALLELLLVLLWWLRTRLGLPLWSLGMSPVHVRVAINRQVTAPA